MPTESPSTGEHRPGEEHPPEGDKGGHERQAAAHRALHRTSTTVALPLVGHVTLPPPDHLAWYGALGALAVLEIIEWPVAAVLAVGRMLADNRRNATLEEFGKALDDIA